ncbi:putative DNA helicase ino80 [Rhizina undulata]
MSGSQQQHSPYNPNPSPNLTYRSSFSPTEQHHPHRNQYQNPPRHGSAAYQSSTNGHSSALPPPLYNTRSGYYDPVDRSGDMSSGWAYPAHERAPSMHSQPARDHSYSYAADTTVDQAVAPSHSPIHTSDSRTSYPAHSPTSATGRMGSVTLRSELRQSVDSNEHMEYSGSHREPISPIVAKANPARRGGAMSISALLTNADEPATETISMTSHTTQPSKRKSLETNNHSPDMATRTSLRQSSAARPASAVNHRVDVEIGENEQAISHVTNSSKKGASFRDFKYHNLMNLVEDDADNTDTDMDDENFRAERSEYFSNALKRKTEIVEQEAEKRKRRRIVFQNKLHEQLDMYAKSSRERARQRFFNDAMEQVMRQEEEDEKERKKEQQRKRRREKAEIEKRAKAEVAVREAQAAAEREAAEHQIRELQRRDAAAERMAQMELNISFSNIGEGQDSDASGTPLNFDDESKAKKRKSIKKRLPKEVVKDGKETSEVKEVKELIPVPEPVKEDFPPHSSGSYNQLFNQILKDIARKDIPRVHRAQQTSLTTKQSNLRKTVQLASKEAQRWKLRTNKNVKDTQARAKRCMREMMTFWKRNEREERDSRRRAEKEAIERAKREEEMREAKRQARKLNFLISQTELYSHFIGRKIKTDEVERSTDSASVGGSSEIINKPVRDPNLASVVDDNVGKAGPTVTNFEDLDFDAEDDAALQQAAINNAQHAIQAAQDRARAFNNQDGEGKTDLANVNLDDGEMNFQNPTSLGDIDIQQPKMLTCQLKEYQLKGLNWLCNLYEQGINGILADEMGLGKTVQSISVMAYLAEHHNIWGPFLVIAPASTLHNWQQEITRFVPQLKALPYWGSAKDRKVLRKFWDRKQLTYTKDSPFHVLITSYQLVVQDAQYFQRMRWQYMILDEAQAIKSSSSSRWKSLLGFHCRNRLLLTELWALLHFIMPSLFDSHDEFSEWFSKDIESHAQSNTQLNEAQLRRLHMILKPFMLRRVKKHVQKELGDKIEVDVFCDLTYRQRALYKGLRDKISIIDIIEKAASGGEETAATLMNLVMQFRKVCNHPDLFERADTRSPLSLTAWGETPSFLREGNLVDVAYTSRNLLSYHVPSLVYREGGRLDLPGRDSSAGIKHHVMLNLLNIWKSDYIKKSVDTDKYSAFSWLRFVDTSPHEASAAFHKSLFDNSLSLRSRRNLGRFKAIYDEEQPWVPAHAKFLIVDLEDKKPLSEVTLEGCMDELLNVSRNVFRNEMMHRMEPLAYPAVSAPPINLVCSNQGVIIEQNNLLFNDRIRKTLYGPSVLEEQRLLESKVDLSIYPTPKALTEPSSELAGYTHVQVPSMRRFVSDSGKLAKLDSLLTELKAGGHRVLLYFQMTKMMDLCEEYLTYRHHRYLRLDGSSKLEDRRDMVAAWQTTPEIFVFILSTRAGGLGINLTAADTVIFYDSDWNPTIDSQAMDRAHRLGQTKQVRVFRLITRGTIEERIRMRAQQKEEVQRVVIQGGDPGAKKNVDFKGSREVATWLFDEEEAEQLERTLEAKEKQAEEAKAKGGARRGKKKASGAAAVTAVEGSNKGVNIEDMYHEGEGRFDDSGKPSEAATPASSGLPAQPKKRGPKPKGGNKKKSTQERLNMIDGVSNRAGDVVMGGM